MSSFIRFKIPCPRVGCTERRSCGRTRPPSALSRAECGPAGAPVGGTRMAENSSGCRLSLRPRLADSPECPAQNTHSGMLVGRGTKCSSQIWGGLFCMMSPVLQSHFGTCCGGPAWTFTRLCPKGCFLGKRQKEPTLEMPSLVVPSHPPSQRMVVHQDRTPPPGGRQGAWPKGTERVAHPKLGSVLRGVLAVFRPAPLPWTVPLVTSSPGFEHTLGMWMTSPPRSSEGACRPRLGPGLGEQSLPKSRREWLQKGFGSIWLQTAHFSPSVQW